MTIFDKKAGPASFKEVCSVPTPDATKTFRPVPHGELINSLRYACKTVGIGIRSEEFTLAHRGARLFGTFTLEPFMRGNGREFTLGFRQGLNKSLSIGVCAGMKVIVCDNMMFDGEFIEFRKHTSGLDDAELVRIAINAVTQSMKKMADFKKWHDHMRAVKVNKYKFKCLTFDAMTQGVFPPAHLGRFLNCYGDERKVQLEMKQNADSLYTWHGGVTRLLRGKSHFQQAESNRLLQGICDNYTVSFRDDD